MPGMNGKLANESSSISLTDKAYMAPLFPNLLELSFFALIGSTPLNETERAVPATAVMAHLVPPRFCMD